MTTPRFLAAQLASVAGTAVDFMVTVACVEFLQVWYLGATMLGNAAGGATNFYLGRHYVFAATGQRAAAQAGRYLLVWAGSLLLNAAGVYLLTQGFGCNYLASKIAVGLLVGVGFNYVLQARFVFEHS